MKKTLILLLFTLLSSCHYSAQVDNKPSLLFAPVLLGIEQQSIYLPQLENKRVGVIVNQTSQANGHHLVDRLIENHVDLQVIFAPEHGFRGSHGAGEQVAHSVDPNTGIKIHSLYGKHKSVTKDQLASLDVIIFDIQDVGVRFYTYISTMHYMMEAAAKAGVEFIVLDRPNPNGRFIDGPVLDLNFQSFVGMHPIPLLHGLTVGELALMIKGEGWLSTKNTLKLTVIKMARYSHQLLSHLPIKPSPNLPNHLSVALYPSLAFFEATPVSVGRGTEIPFQVFGHDIVRLGKYQFIPQANTGAKWPKLENRIVWGQRLDTSKGGLDLSYLINTHQQFKQANIPLFSSPDFMDKLAGTNKLRIAIEQGKTQQEIKQSWQAELTQYKKIRSHYLLYP